LDHEAGEAFEGTWYPDSWRDLDENAFRCMDVDLQLASLVDGGVEEREKTLKQRLVDDEAVD
jgi:hypothetical protein